MRTKQMSMLWISLILSWILSMSLSVTARANLLVYYAFDEGSGVDVRDISGNGNNAIMHNMDDTSWVDGKEQRFGTCLALDGIDDYLTTDGFFSEPLDGDFTLSMWFTGTPGRRARLFQLRAGDTQMVNVRIIDDILSIDDHGGVQAEDSGDVIVTDQQWHHFAIVRSGLSLIAYLDGEQHMDTSLQEVLTMDNVSIGVRDRDGEQDDYLPGKVDDFRIYTVALSADEIRTTMVPGGSFPQASGPSPKDGALHTDTWVSLSWRAGDFAVSHDVYLGDSFDDVNNGADDTFRGNHTLTFIIAGFPGNPYPDGLVPGTTYYWRVDEVNEAEPNSPWKGDVWSFSIPPKTAYSPDPVDGAESVDLNVQLSWTAGFGTKLHYIVIGEDFDEVNNATMGVPNGTTNYNPGSLKLAKTYYWRVDEFDSIEMHKGDIWSFTTEGAVSGPNPANGAVDVSPTQILTWDAGAVAASHEVYFGTDPDAVKNATKSSPDYKGAKALGEESYDPGKLLLETTYYWRIDEVNGVNPDSPWAGNVWSLTTGNFFVIDDFEDYDVGNNEIWWAWKDGLGYVAHDNEPAYPGNGTGAAVGDETTASYTEETIVHRANQSMPFLYDNNKQGYAYYSEAELTLTVQRDWIQEGVAELSLWFRGHPASVGSFVEGSVGTYTMTATGADIWNQADEFHFASKILTGPGSIIARVESVEQTDNWAKAGVMIRETLDAGSKFAAVYITPTNTDGTATNGCRFQARTDTDASATSDSGVATSKQTAIVAPYWVKLERDVSGNFRGYYSSNGSTWKSMAWNPQFITMSSNVYVGLALTSHNASATCEAEFSNVMITGTVSAQWTNQDIGIESNAAEPLYMAISNSAGAPAVVVHDDPAAATIDTWTEWIIPLQAFADQGIALTNVDRIAVGLGNKGNMTIPGGSGKMYFDDIRLYLLRSTP